MIGTAVATIGFLPIFWSVAALVALALPVTNRGIKRTPPQL
jgi:hypothetical protein